MKVNTEAHWRDTARSIKFFFLDGKAVFPLVLVLMYWRLWTVIVAVLSTIFFTILNRYGFTPIVFFRWLRSVIAGKRKISIPWWMQ